MAPPKPAMPSRERPAWLTTALVIAVSVAVGFFVLPRLSPGSARFEGDEAPDFVLEVIHGGEVGNRVRLSDLRGRTVLLDFWASWCPACRQQASILDQLARSRESEEVLVLGVATGDTRAAAEGFARSRNLAYPVVIDAEQRVGAAYGASSLPLLVVVNPGGRVTAVRPGVVGTRELVKLTQEASSGEPAAH